jgi:hypothetical protein
MLLRGVGRFIAQDTGNLALEGQILFNFTLLFPGSDYF